MLIAGLAALVVLGGGGGAAAWFFSRPKSTPAPSSQIKPKHTLPPVFVTLEPFVVNLAGDVQRYLQVGIDLRVADGAVTEQVKMHLPEIRNGVLLLLSSKKVEDLANVEQKNFLRAEIREAVNKPLGINTPAPKAAAAEALPASPALSGTAAVPAPPTHSAEHPPAANLDAGVLEVLLTSFVIQ